MSDRLPKRPIDRVLVVATVLAILGALFIVAAGAFADIPKATVSGGSTPTASPMLFRECPFCMRLYPGKANAERTQFVFDDHVFLSMPLSETVRFETCVWQYRKHAAEMFETMRKVGAGRFVEVPKGNIP